MRLLIGIIAALLLASSAQATDQFMFYREMLLYQTDSTIINADTFTYCFSTGRYDGVGGQVCESEWISDMLVYEDFILTKIVVVLMSPTGSAGSVCAVRMQDYTHTPYPEMDDMEFAADAAPTTFSFRPTTPFLVPDGNFIEFAYGIGTGPTCNDAVTDAYAFVRVYGVPLWSIR